MELPESLAERMWDSLHEAYCGMHGHDSLLQFESGRICLKCASCGHESPGWQVREAPVASRLRESAGHHALTNLVDVRRVA